MENEDESYKAPSRFFLLVHRAGKGPKILGTASLQGFTEQSAQKHLPMAENLPGAMYAEVIEVESLFDQQ